MEHPEYTPENSVEADAFAQQVASNPAAALLRFNELQAQNKALRAAQDTPQTSSTSSTAPPPSPAPAASTYASLDPQTLAVIAQIVAQTIQNQPPPSIPAPVVNISPAPTTASATSVRLSEKLPDIEYYSGEKDKLEPWLQALLQRLDALADRYPTEKSKIAYAENRLLIGSKAHNLMNLWRKAGVCTLSTLADWIEKLRDCCGNPFEAQDARKYLRDELRQGSSTFNDYYNLFVQKMARSQLDELSLIDCLERGVSFSVQQQAILYRPKPVTFLEWIAAYKDIDDSQQALKHRLPRNTTTVSAPAASKPKSSTPSPSVAPRVNLTVPAATAIPAAAPVVTAIAGDPMDLDSAIAVVAGKPLNTPGVRDICNKWQLCYYCKKQHPGKTAKECPNKKASFSLRVVDLDNDPNTDGGVSVKA